MRSLADTSAYLCMSQNVNMVFLHAVTSWMHELKGPKHAMVTRDLQLGVLLFEGGFMVGQNPLLRHGSPTAISLLYPRLVYSLQHDSLHHY